MFANCSRKYVAEAQQVMVRSNLTKAVFTVPTINNVSKVTAAGADIR